MTYTLTDFLIFPGGAVLSYLIISALFIYIPAIFYYVDKKEYPFYGKIETFADIKGFIVNKNMLSFQDKDENGNMCQYTMVNIVECDKIYELPRKYKTINISPGIYKSQIGDLDWQNENNKINVPIRAFIWEHVNAINKQLAIDNETEEKTKEKESKEKERLARLRQLDRQIRKSY